MFFYFNYRALADTDSDGCMNVNEFSIACKLINLKLRGFEVPKTLPPTLLMSLASVGGTPSRTPTGAMSPIAGGPPPKPPQPAILQQQQQLQQQQLYQQQLLQQQQQQVNAAPPRPAIPPQPIIAQQHQQLPPQMPPQPVAMMPGVGVIAPAIPPQPSILAQQQLASGIAGATAVQQSPALFPALNNVAVPPGIQSQIPMATAGVYGVVPSQPLAQTQPTAVVKPMEANLLDSSLIGGVSAQQPPSVIPTATIAPGIIPGTFPGQIAASIPGQIPGGTGMLPQQATVGVIPGITPLPQATGLGGLAGVQIPSAVVPPMTNIAPIIPTGAIPAPPTPPSGTQSRSMSISGDQRAPSIESPSAGGGADWSVKGPAKLKYTQLFNSIDRNRSGFLTGAQARGILMQSKLPQATLAQIWSLSDMDQDGRLGCEEFVLAMYLCDLALQGESIPKVLPIDLIPPSFRKVGSKVTSRAGSVVTSRHGSVSSQGAIEPDPSAGLPQNSFEDKRKENFDKGQAELDRRRRVIEDQQRKERVSLVLLFI